MNKNKWEMVVEVSLFLIIVSCFGYQVLFLRMNDKIFHYLFVLVLLVGFKLIQKKFMLSSYKWLNCLVEIFGLMSGVLGEGYNFYNKFWWWDLVVHALGGFIVMGVGYLILKMRKSQGVMLFLLPFCFSMTVAVFWEFGEFLVDKVFYVDAERDTLVNKFASFKLDKGENKVVLVDNIKRVVLYNERDEVVGEIKGGYLDLGLSDTMGDLGANMVGALLFGLGLYIFRREINLS